MIKTTPLRHVPSQLGIVVAFAAALLCIPTAGFAAPILKPALASFAVLGATAVTNVPMSTIGGNLGAASGTSVGGGYIFTAGSLQANTALAAQAQLDLDAAIVAVNAFVAPAANTIAAGNLNLQNFQSSQASGVISPGTYAVGAGTSNFDSTITLDGGGSNTAQWYFQFSSTLITGTNSKVLVQNVGTGEGVGIYWTVGTAATLNGPTFAGNVLANTLISSDGNLTVACGRLLSATDQVTLIQDSISITGCTTGTNGETSGGYDQGVGIGSGGTGGSGGQVENGVVPEPGTLLLLGTGIAGLVSRRRRSARGQQRDLAPKA